jgi:GxxExxY protein
LLPWYLRRNVLVIEKRLIAELKSVEEITALDEAQILMYLRLAGFKIGLPSNFDARRLVDGLKRYKQ